jgi:tetratricopeptide (TPR) repeat protein
MLRRLNFILREWYFTLRAWMSEWVELLTSPFRSFRPRAFLSEMTSGGRDAVLIGRGFMRATADIVIGFVWFLITLPRQAIRFVTRAVPFAWWWLRTRTRGQLLLTVGAAAIVLIACSTPVYLLWERHRDNQRANLWRLYDRYLDTGDAEKLESTLHSLEKMSPGDPQIAQRLSQLRSREAPAGDSRFIRFLLRMHGNEGRIDLAAREAAKLVENLPDDWEARCVLIDDASRRGDKKAVRKHLAALPSATESDSIPPHVALYSAGLFQRVGDTARYDQIIKYIFINVLPSLRREDLPRFGPDVAILLVNCYHTALTQMDHFQRPTKFWAPAQQACRSVLDMSDVPQRCLEALGETQERNPQILQEFKRHKLITDDEYKSMSAEVEANIREVWEKLLERDPHSSKAYIGLAFYQARNGDIPAGVRIASKGLEACGNRPELIAAMGKLLRATDPLAGLAFLQKYRESLGDQGLSPPMCQVFAEVALQAGRPDLARQACQWAIKQVPGLLWAHRTEGEICLRLGKNVEAAATLRSVKTELAKDPSGCALYVRALCACESYQLAEEFLEQVKAENQPIEALLQAAEAMQVAGRREDAVRWAKQVLNSEYTNTKALLIVADCQQKLAEQGDRGWDGDRVREALRHYRSVQRQDPKNLTVVNNIVWLELKALKQPKEALASAAPLRAVENNVNTPADFLETLGAVYLANGQYDKAKEMLTQAIATAGKRASFYTHLALAYHGLKQWTASVQCLEEAVHLPKTDRELAEMTDAAHIIYGR